MKALREIRDLFGIDAKAESKLGAGTPKGGLALEALLRNGAARLVTRWSKPLETGAEIQPSESQGEAREVNSPRA